MLFLGSIGETSPIIIYLFKFLRWTFKVVVIKCCWWVKLSMKFWPSPYALKPTGIWLFRNYLSDFDFVYLSKKHGLQKISWKYPNNGTTTACQEGCRVSISPTKLIRFHKDTQVWRFFCEEIWCETKDYRGPIKPSFKNIPNVWAN